ncbi:LysR family transcriptional regulator [Luteibacter aegosomaticola]|uniref:LysR family transcriptional regulator n=1 Tax=Luteibacter aegosomaticola TaxID=2911538 RepID=UPI001FFA436C|nr:LysR family transcriptional regulator [Luteibacter aegosomaticola]UPG88044.1 LysR family transcriptional regulator [Luteibacter aegosomaticola]
MDSLSSFTTFVHAAETRSFTDAGRRMGLSASAVGKTIVRLEAHLGVRLFHRTTRSVSLTPEGERLLESCRRILAEVDAVESELAGQHAAPKGKLRVTLPQLGRLFAPAMASFLQRYPDIELDLDFSDRLVDIVDEGFDLAVRTGEGVDSRLMSKRIGVYHLVLVASPAYLARAGTPIVPADLRAHALLHHRYPTTGKLEPWPIRRATGEQELALPVAAAASTLAPLLEMAEADAGITCLPDFIVQHSVRDHRLVRVLDEHIEHANVFRAVWPSSRHMPPRLRAFIDHLAASLFPVSAGS